MPFNEDSVKSLNYNIQLEQRGIEKLNQLYIYADSDMSEEKYLEEKDKIETKLQVLTTNLKRISKQNTKQIPEDILVYTFLRQNKLCKFKGGACHRLSLFYFL